MRIGSQNCQGNALGKLKLKEVQSCIQSFDLFVVTETWLDKNVVLQVPGYRYFRSDRKQLRKRSKRPSGGVVVLYKSSLAGGVTKLTSGYEDIVWVKLDKEFFSFERDVYLACCYIPPDNSTYVKNLLKNGGLSVLKLKLRLRDTRLITYPKGQVGISM